LDNLSAKGADKNSGESQEEMNVATVAFVSSILPGKQEEWRRFCQVLQGSRRAEYEESRRRLGITRELAWLA
jgi:hypothetical protein